MWPTETTHKSGARWFGVVTLAVGALFSFLAAADTEPVSAQTGNEHFSVRMAEQEIHGYDWEEAVEVTVAVDDPGTPANPDWTDTQLAVPAEWDPSTGFVQFQPFVDDFVIEPGFVVTMTQLGVIKTHVVTSLEVADVNQDTDVVSGVGDEGATITVSVWDEVGTWREATVTGGTWSADFSVAGPGGDPVDIARGTAGEANQTDVDNDSTQWTWRVPDPAFSVETPNNIWSVNDGWIPGRTVTVIVDDDPNPGDDVPLYETTAPVTSWGPSPWEAGWGIDNLGFTIAPGHYITVDDGVEVTKTLLVTELTITAVDETNDLVSGTAAAGAQVEVHACEQFLCGNRSVTADGAGAWVADFAVPGPGDHEQDVIDIQSGIGGAAQIVDADGDSTHRGWQLQEPYFGVDVINEEMWAVNWPGGETLTFQVYADDSAADLLWTDTMTVYGTPWQNTEAGYRFWSEFDVAAGQYFTVSDGVTTKNLVVSTLTVTAVDPGSDVYTGTVDATVPADVTSEVCAWARGIDGDPNDGLELCDLPDPVTGEWTIDFAGVGDIIPGDHLGAYQRDVDGDETSHAWAVPPWIYVELAEQDEFGNDLYPDRVHLEQWTGPVDIYLGGALAMEGVVTNGGYRQVDLDVEIGQTIRVVDAVDDKSLDIELLTVDDVTAWDDPVQPSTAFGTAAIPDHSRQIQVTATAEYGWWTERWVPVVGGQYQADFANPGNGWRESEIGYFGEGGADDIYLGGEVRANLWDSDNDQVQAIWHTCNPRIIIVRGNDRIEAVCFPVGSELVVELDDPATGAGIDWSSGAPVTVTRNPDKPWETLVVFELGEYTAPDNATVTATASEGGVPVVVVTTEVIPFTIDVIDEDTDSITGTAPAGSEVLVEADGNWRYPVADATNTWVADFSQPGERPGEENPVDLRSGSQGGATLIDETGSATTIAWRISSPVVNVDSQQNQLWGHEWLPDAEVTVTIGAESWTLPTDGEGNFGEGWDYEALDLVPGMLVEVTDGESTKSHTITNLAVTNVDADTDVISGTATAGSFVDAWIHDTDVHYTLPVDEFGNWSVDTTANHDLVPGSNGNSAQCDSDGDCTYAGWRIPLAQLQVSPADNWLSGQEWLADAEVTVTIGAESWTLPTDGEGNFGEGWDSEAIDLVPGMVVEVTDGESTKSHTITDLAVTSVDSDTDVISGTATAGSYIDVWIHDTNVGYTLPVDEFGTWSVDTTADHDLVPGSNGNSSECDDDGDCTYAGWRVAFPTFEVDPGTDNIWGAEFLPNTELTITVGGVTVPGGPYSTGEGGGFGDGWDPLPTDVTPGTVVTVSDGETTKAHTVTDLAVTSVDADTNIVAGTATPNALVQVEIHGLLRRVVTADSAGNWSVDFSDQHDLVPGEAGEANESDPDGDSTHASWRVVNPLFWVDPADESLSIRDFLPNAELTITVNDNPVPGGPYVTDEWGTSGADFDPAELDLAADDVVVISDGESTKTHTVTELAITAADPDTDEVLGVAAPGSSVHVWVHDPDVQRNVVAGPDRGDGLGEWIADFTAAGIIAPGDSGTADLGLDSNGNSIQCDADEDCTNAFWWVSNPTFSVETPHWIWSSNQDWELGDTITLTVDDPDFPGPMTTTVSPSEGNPSYHGWWFDLDGIFEIQPGHEVMVTDGETTKTLNVLDLTIDTIDGENDTVSGRLLDGSGAPLAGVAVEVHADRQDGDNSHRAATTDPDGYWVADFAAPGEGEASEPFSIEPNTGVSAQVYDLNWDSTHRGDCFECGPANAAIEIDKQAATQTAGPGDGILAAPGETVTWIYRVSNVGDVDVVEITVSDNAFGAICDVSLLAAGDDVTCTHEEVAEPGDHANVATATGTAVDAGGHTQPVEAEDGSSYRGLDHGYVTDSSLCVFDGFDLVFTPDMRNWPGSYRLTASNPGQFYWNTFIRADAGATIELEIPYPFVTQGAMPLQSHGAVDVGDGQCFAPVGDGDAHPATFALGDFTDTNGDGSVGYGDFYTVAVEATGEFQYLTLHLDYGLKGTRGWNRSDDNALNDPGLNPDLVGVEVINGASYSFRSAVDGSESVLATIVNRNEFKNVKGFGGLVSKAGEPVSEAAVELRDADGILLETMVTDGHGWYLSEYVHRGRAADYMVVLLGDDGAPAADQSVTVGAGIHFGEASFTL